MHALNHARAEGRHRLGGELPEQAPAPGPTPEETLLRQERRAAMARALFLGRDYTLPDDVQKLAPAVLAHRLVLDRRSGLRGESRRSVLISLLRDIKVPAVS